MASELSIGVILMGDAWGGVEIYAAQLTRVWLKPVTDVRSASNEVRTPGEGRN
jgi:hypothetical protein